MGLELPLGAAVALLLAVLGWIWKLSSRLTKADDKIESAQIAAANASAKTTILEHGLAEHREHVAAGYVSRDALAEITGAINRLGDRLDALFLHFMPSKP